LIGLLQRKTSGVADLKVGRLRLVAILPEMLVAEQAGELAELGRLLGARLTAEWPPAEWEPHVYRFILKQYEEWPQSMGWHRYVLLEHGLGRGRTLVGAVGGFPKAEGDVEIGYSTLPEFQRRGYATAFARALVEWLLGLEGVRSVSAQTFPRMPESIKVMERCGMSFVGDGDDAGTVRYRRSRD
jgi:RimJ/RimL family protein N-acetyltransferase